MTVLPFRYYAHGLGVHSQVPLGVAASDDAPCDVRIQFSDTTPPSLARENEMLVRYEGGITCLLKDGCDVTAFTSPPITDALAEFLSGNALAILLHQRGHAVLHASCVRTPDIDVAFAGPSGAGKSTMAAAMLQRGHALVADDFISLAGRDIERGFPQIRLWQDAVVATGLGAAAPGSDEKQTVNLNATSAASGEPRPIHIVFLADSDAADSDAADSSASGPPTITRLHPRDALFNLLSNAYCAPLLDQQGLATEFHRWRAIATSTPCWMLKRARNLAQLQEIAALVEEPATFA